MRYDLKSASEAIRRLNPQLFGLGSVAAEKHSQPARALDGGSQAQRPRKSRVVAGNELTVTLCAFIPRRLDPDNLGTAFKPLQDAIADWLGVDDGDERIRWEYGQCETRGECGVVVKLERTL